MRYTADVLIDRKPFAHQLRVEGSRVIVGIGVAEVVPGRVDEGIHRVGVPCRFTPALRAVDRRPRDGATQR